MSTPFYVGVKDGSPDGIVREYPSRFLVPPMIGMKVERCGVVRTIVSLDYVNAQAALDDGTWIPIICDPAGPGLTDGWGAFDEHPGADGQHG